MSEQKSAKINEFGLNLEQEEFCQLYISKDAEMFGNGVQSYLEAYEIDTSKPNYYKTAMACSSRLLTKAKIILRINGLLEEGGFNESNIDKQHLFLINQHADLKTKLGAIKEYNALKQRITNKLDITSAGKPIIQIANEIATKYELNTPPSDNSEG